MVGPTFSIDQLVAVPSTAAEAEARHHHPCIFMNAEGGDNDPEGSAIEESSEKSADYSSDSSSSIGSPSDDEDDEENAVSSKGGLASLDSMEESLPNNRKGLSNHFSGKSKSFGNLSDMSCCTEMKDVEKPENPFNKRRRILMANKLFNSSTRKSSFYGWSNNPKSMPILAAAALDELEEERGTVYEDHDHPSSSSSSSSSLVSPTKDEKLKSGLSFKSRSCFALSDLQEEEDDDDDD